MLAGEREGRMNYKCRIDLYIYTTMCETDVCEC